MGKLRMDSPHSRSGLRLLVVDDYPDAAESLRTLLDLLGHDVETAASVLEAEALARAHPPDVVLCEVRLQGEDGCGLARSFRSHPALQSALLVALTTAGWESDRRRIREAGFDHHLLKPADLTELLGLLRRVRPLTTEVL